MIGPEHHGEIRENLPAFVLRGLDPAEEAAIREHLTDGCDACREELASYGPLPDALNLAPPDVPLPPDARSRLLERAGNARRLREARGDLEAPPSRPSPRRPSRLPAVLAAAALIVAVLLGGLLYAQNRGLSSEVAQKQQTIDGVVDLMERADVRVEDLPTPNSVVRTRVYAAREGDVGMYVFDRLPPLAEGQVYQLWVGEEEDLKENVGTFVPTDGEKGSYHKLLSPQGGFDAYEYVGIAAVPEGGLEEPPPPEAPAWVMKAELPAPDQASLF